ncbi:YncE family protein [Desulforhopalus singaporensis]|uniref:Uncharacterized protein n=1 Tax=Desulforhopalus singaporensis TaxID=91360 RepID=A0A1H0Q0A3_9BACT|nr:hypothetical protein [Desulforhopalus singaporensis]SDP10500.1 hypothetical protein SAMN05660330_01830 [Desulforhopalus singaporensis]
MKIHSILGTGVCALLFASSGAANSVPDSGQDNMIQWDTQAQWAIKGNPIDMVHSLDGKLVYILNDSNQVQIYNTAGKLQGTIPVDDGVSAIDIAAKGEKLYLTNKATSTFQAISVYFVHNIDITGSPIHGPADAPVTIAVFSDFE